MHWGLVLPCVCFELSFFCTCVSVRRRDRCTRTALIRFAVSCLVLLHAPPPLLSSVRFVPCSGPAHFAFHLLCLCCPPSLCLSFASLHVLPCEARVIVLSLCSCGFASSSFLFFALLAVLVRALVVCSPLLWFLSLSFLPSLPREWSCLCSGPACTLVCWYFPLSIWLQL